MFDSRLRWSALAALSFLPSQVSPVALHAQAPAAARQLGTVKAIDGSTLTLITAAGATVMVTVAADAKVSQLAPGSTNLKDATPASVGDVSVGDRVLAIGAAADANSLAASRLILMKSSDIAAKNAEEMREWQRGFGGLVKTVDGSTITVASGTRMLKIETTSDTVFKRYAADSVNFGDAQPGALAGVHPGDQLRARGTVDDDRLSMTAKEIVSGSFENLSGVISAVNPSAGTLTLKDLATKKTVTVAVTSKSDLRNLPAQAAAAFAARNAPGAGAGGAGTGKPAAGQPARPAGTIGTGAGGYGARRAGADLSQMLSRLPTQTLADLHTGEAVMIVASPDANGSPTAITLLSGVESILSATPSGQQPITLSPWSLGGPEGGAAAGEGGGGGSH
jgi:hypothetical protein